jgi:hypothetical protein
MQKETVKSQFVWKDAHNLPIAERVPETIMSEVQNNIAEVLRLFKHEITSEPYYYTDSSVACITKIKDPRF